MREAGLVITSDLCPVSPGSCTRLSTSLQIITCNRLGQSLISLLEPDYPSLALAVWRGLRTLSDGVLLSLFILDERQALREERWCGAHHTDARAAYRSDERHFECCPCAWSCQA